MLRPRRTISQHALIDIIHPDVFQPRTELIQQDIIRKQYRIPEHQRFPAWSTKKKQSLVESVLNNWPIHAIILSKHVEQHFSYDDQEPTFNEYFNIEDGQTRLSALQDFFLDKFPTTDTNGLLYSQLSIQEQTYFTSYQISTEVFTMTGNRAATIDCMANIFDRLNSGTPLGNNAKYYARKQTPIVDYSLRLSIDDTFRDWFNKYIGTVGGGKKRNLMADMVGANLSIVKRSEASLNTSYQRNYHLLTDSVQDTDIATIRLFYTSYFTFLDTTIGVANTKPNKIYGKLSGILGLAICSWINYGNIHESLNWYIKKKYYTPKYEPPLFAELTTGERRICQGTAIRNRLDKIIQQFNNDHVTPNVAPPGNDQNREDKSATTTVGCDMCEGYGYPGEMYVCEDTWISCPGCSGRYEDEEEEEEEEAEGDSDNDSESS